MRSRSPEMRIAETVHYLVTGETVAAERPKNDRSSFEPVEAET